MSGRVTLRLATGRWWTWLAVATLAQASIPLASHAWLRGASPAAPAWPAAGVAVAILLAGGGRYWAAVPLGSMLAFLLAGASTSGFPVTTLVLLAQGAGSLALLRRALGDRPPELDRVRDVGVLVRSTLVAALGAAAVFTALPALPALPGAPGGLGEPEAWRFATWASGGALGAFLVPALLAAVRQGGRSTRDTRGSLLLAVASILLVALASAGFLMPWNWRGITSVAIVIAIPVVIWVALQAGARATLGLVLLLAIIATVGTMRGDGAFGAPGRTMSQRELLLNAYLYLSAWLSLVTHASIAEREAALRRERETRTRFEQVLRHSTEGITLYQADAAGILRCVDVNDRTAAILFDGDLERARAAMIGRTREEIGDRLLYRDPARAARAAELVREAVTTRRSVTESFTIEQADGLTTFDVTYTPILGDDGRLTHLLVASHDVSERERAAVALARSEARFRRIFESTVLGVFSWHGSGAITHANQAFLDLVGHTPDDLAAGRLDWTRLTPPDFADITARQHDEVRTTGHCEPFETAYVRKDGQRVSVMVAASLWAPGRDEGFATVLDVTAQRQAEQALRSITQGTSAVTGEAFFQALVRELHVATGADHVLVAVVQGEPPRRARSIAFWSGGRLAEPVSYDLRATPCEDVAGGEACYFATGVARRFPEDAMLSALRADSYLGVPLIGTTGQPAGILCVVHSRPLDRPDWARTLLTVFATRAAAELQRLQAQEALRASEARLATVFDTVSDQLSLWAVDELGATRLVSLNRAARAAADPQGRLDWQRDLIGQGLLAVVRTLLERGDLPPAGIDAVVETNRQSLRQLLAAAMPTRHEEVHDVRGTPSAFEVEMLPVTDGRGLITHILRVTRDVSERRSAEAARMDREARERQQQKLEAIGTLAGGIAHDFNNILTGISGNVELAREDLPAGHEAIERLDAVSRAVQRARNVVWQILTFSQGHEAGHTPVRVAEAIRATAELVRGSVPPTVEVVTDVADPDDTVLADPGQLSLLLVNLATNGAQAMRDGRGRLAISAHRATVGEGHPALAQGAAPGEYTRLIVEDNGVGMGPDVFRRIFDPFFTTRPQGEGSGLGLPVVHGIVRAHGGAVLVSSTAGVGTRVEVFLPRMATAPPAPPPRPPGPPRGRGERILLVDDEDSIIDVGSRLLTWLGYAVTAFRDPKEALAAFRSDPGAFDLVLSDLTMPGLSGLDLARRVGAVRPDLPFILTTGFAGSYRDEVRDITGIVEVMDKPFDRDTLARALRAALDATRAESPG